MFWNNGPFVDGIPHFIWAILVSFLNLLVLGLVIWLVVTLFRRTPPNASGSRALEVLEERYARGEISRDEFIERRSVLRGDPSAPEP